jgi:hypothetical protein
MITALFMDLSRSRTGWAVGGHAMAQPQWGAFEPGDWKDREHEVLGDFWDLLKELHNQHTTLTHIGFESIFINAEAFQFNGTDSQLLLKAVLLLFARQRRLEIGQVANATLFKHFTGSGRAPGATRGERRRERKRMVIAAAKFRGWNVGNDDEADALAGLDYMLCMLDRHYGGRSDPLATMSADFMAGIRS